MSKQILPGLGELESAIMEVIWQNQALTVREVLQKLNQGQAYTTIMTVMQRLTEKGILKRKLHDNTYSYEAVFCREKFSQLAVEKAINQLVAGFGDLAMAQFINTMDEVDPKRLKILRNKIKKSKP